MNAELFELANKDSVMHQSYAKDNDYSLDGVESLFHGHLSKYEFPLSNKELDDGMDKDGVILLIDMPLCSGGDYSGSDVSIANYRYMLREFTPKEGVISYYGGYGGYGILLIVPNLKIKTRERVVDILQDLKDYPVIDEELFSEVTAELEQQAWHDWIKEAFRREIKEKFGESLGEHDLHDLFWEVVTSGNYEFINEYNSMWIDVGQIVKDLTSKQLAKTIKEIQEQP